MTKDLKYQEVGIRKYFSQILVHDLPRTSRTMAILFVTPVDVSLCTMQIAL